MIWWLLPPNRWIQTYIIGEYKTQIGEYRPTGLMWASPCLLSFSLLPISLHLPSPTFHPHMSSSSASKKQTHSCLGVFTWALSLDLTYSSIFSIIQPSAQMSPHPRGSPCLTIVLQKFHTLPCPFFFTLFYFPFYHLSVT